MKGSIIIIEKSMKNQIDINSVKYMYNEMKEIWPQSDKWYCYTYSQIFNYLTAISKKYCFSQKTLILNAGSGGNTYNIPGIHYHIDIAEQKLKDIPHSYIGNIENTSFEDNMFDVCICVGSVINYCDAMMAIGEMRRVLKERGLLILDYDQSRSLEFLGTSHFGKTADIIETFNSGYIDKTWIYSPKYISSILKRQNFNILNINYYHLLSSLAYRILQDENKASNFTKYDKIIKHIPILNKLSCNVILCSQKV